MMPEHIIEPIYKKIALDLAGRIHKGEFSEGEKIHGRSTLAGEYNVSPETIRRAMILLEDMEVVSVSQGSGIYIKSKDDASKYLERFKNNESIGVLKLEIKQLMDQKKIIDNQIQGLLEKIIDYSERLKNINPINPLEIEIPPHSNLIGKTILESKFWQHTGATIVAIRRGKNVVISPGPYGGFEAGDVILVVGNSEVKSLIRKFIEES